ncbi:hypothetical protein HYFRA_00012485 [Hymenoscyphus fraxineus]|uniref:Serine/threonine-protein kinase ATG1 n=1 Tax=Hymenoscyphus fraxineus TaxID=746836 RepID=A0A9N9PV85_9HELO|nr:hypothetical protein HYFRA_00012485 [Hymenoscyphus fraxineus]
MAERPPPSSSARRTRTVEKGDRTIGSFTIEEKIGKGSFASVYRGTHKKDGAVVAIKSVTLGALNEKLKANLYCEIEILKALHHPHIVGLIDCRESSSHIHLVMEYCILGDLSYFIKHRASLHDNPALRDMIRKYPLSPAPIGALNEVVVRHFLKQLASAMEFMRARDLMHRDIKPQNLLLVPPPDYLARSNDKMMVMSAYEKPDVPMAGLTSLPLLKIADFGFARSLPKTSLAETLCGSPLYMAPEILRYEKYDAKADLWSIGTVLFEMLVGKAPFRANNHVELLRKIEMSEDQIEFPKKLIITSGLKDLLRALLRRKPGERIEFTDFFRHRVVEEPIPGLVEDDRPQESRAPSKSEDTPLARTSSTRSNHQRDMKIEPSGQSSLPIERAKTFPPTRPTDPDQQELSRTPSNRQASRGQIVDPKRPSMMPSATAPNAGAIHPGRSSPQTQGVIRAPSRQDSVDNSLKTSSAESLQNQKAIAEAEQAVRDAREFVWVEKRAVEVNAFADELAAGPNLQTKTSMGGRAGQITRRATTQGPPSSATGAVQPYQSRAVQVAQGKPRPETVPQRQNSFGRSYGSPSAASALTKVLHGASLRMFGVAWTPELIGKGLSPPQPYGPFPAYPTPHVPVGLLGDGKSNVSIDEEQRVINAIEESAQLSHVVYGFAEVKYKQLTPLTPSMDHRLGGNTMDNNSDSVEDDGLTVEAVVVLSEEAYVLYIKALSLIQKSFDISRNWYDRKIRGDGIGQHLESAPSADSRKRIDGAVQWVRVRFNELYEKADFVQMKLIDAQKRLPEDHPGHPRNHPISFNGDVYLSTPGLSAERLMYDRATEMSRSAAINEMTTEDLPGCERSFITAIRMLEAVLETDDPAPRQRRRASSLREQVTREANDGLINAEDRQVIQNLIIGCKSRLKKVREKIARIAKYQAPSSPRPSSRPSSIIHSGGTTPTTANTPPMH